MPPHAPYSPDADEQKPLLSRIGQLVVWWYSTGNKHPFCSATLWWLLCKGTDDRTEVGLVHLQFSRVTSCLFMDWEAQWLCCSFSEVPQLRASCRLQSEWNISLPAKGRLSCCLQSIFVLMCRIPLFWKLSALLCSDKKLTTQMWISRVCKSLLV